MPPHSTPAAIDARMHRGISTHAGAFTKMATRHAASEPTIYCPSAPMLKMPVLKEKATERPVRM